MLGTRIHLPLRMVESHVACLAGLWLPGFLDRKDMPCVAGIAGSDSKPDSCLFQVFNLFFSFQSDLVTSATAFHSLHQFHGLPVCCGHGIHRCPGRRMLSFLELFYLFIMTVGACIGSRDFHVCDIIWIFVLIAVANRAVHIVLAVFAELPIRDDIRSDFFVAVETFLSRGNSAQGNDHKSNDERF